MHTIAYTSCFRGTVRLENVTLCHHKPSELFLKAKIMQNIRLVALALCKRVHTVYLERDWGFFFYFCGYKERLETKNIVKMIYEARELRVSYILFYKTNRTL